LLLLTILLVSAAALSCSAPAPSADIGMTVHPRGAGAATVKRQFDLMAQMKATWVRVDIDWSVVESQRGQFDWAYPDLIVDEAAAHGMNVLAVLAFSPDWSRTSTGDPATARHSRPDQLTDYAHFARLAAERYAPRGVRTWEIWNEPNTRKFWPPRPDADEYADVFRAAADAIRGVSPDSTLLIGGLSPKFEEPEAEIAPVVYLEQLYANGAAQLADGIAVHPYSFPRWPMDPHPRTDGGFYHLPDVRAVMERNGDDRKRLWITEFGAPTGTGPYAVSEDDQAAALLQARDQVQRWDWAGPLIYYELVDGGTDTDDTEQNFGLLREDLSPKAAAVALMG
jgi:GH35 family endo-1,4-beta-xylanase